MADRYFDHIVGCLDASIKAAEDGVDCHIPAVTVQGAVDLLKEQQAKIERLNEKVERLKPHCFNVDVDALCQDLDAEGR